jgi:hypothetical protein
MLFRRRAQIGPDLVSIIIDHGTSACVYWKK